MTPKIPFSFTKYEDQCHPFDFATIQLLFKNTFIVSRAIYQTLAKLFWVALNTTLSHKRIFCFQNSYPETDLTYFLPKLGLGIYHGLKWTRNRSKH